MDVLINFYDQLNNNLHFKARLIEERAKLEEKVTAQLEAEKSALLEKKRREQDDARRRQDELERILAENRRKVSEDIISAPFRLLIC